MHLELCFESFLKYNAIVYYIKWHYYYCILHCMTLFLLYITLHDTIITVYYIAWHYFYCILHCMTLLLLYTTLHDIIITIDYITWYYYCYQLYHVTSLLLMLMLLYIAYIPSSGSYIALYIRGAAFLQICLCRLI